MLKVAEKWEEVRQAFAEAIKGGKCIYFKFCPFYKEVCEKTD